MPDYHDQTKIMDAVHLMLEAIGEDPKREGLQQTPLRVARAYCQMFDGYNIDPSDVMTTFTECGGFKDVVLLRNIEFHSTCEHHMLPFSGIAHIGYIPENHVIGVSKLARILDIFAHRLQIQERISQQVTDTLMEYLQPQAAACILIAKHHCIMCRGANKQKSEMVTSSIQGSWRDFPEARNELMHLIQM